MMKVAIKKIRILQSSLGSDNEIKTLQSCDTLYIVKYHGVVRKENELWVLAIGTNDD